VTRIQIEGLTKRFAGVTAVDRITLEIDAGEFLVLLGPSGCGKSTLLRMIAGLIPPSAGRLLLNGQDITYTSPRDRDLAMVFQSYALYPHLTVERNIGFPLRARRSAKVEISRKVAEVAAVLELDALLRRRPRELSGGQRQRVALARALVRDPSAFLMDEPLSNLDAKLRAATRAELTELHRKLGSTFVYVTHDQVEAMTMATRIAVLNAGRLEQVGTPSQVYDEPASTFVAGFLGSPPMNLLDGRVCGRSGQLRVIANDVDVPLGIGDDGTQLDIVIGVRPEHLVPVDPDTAAPAHAVDGAGAAGPTPTPDVVGPRLRGTVQRVENLGSEEVAHVLVGDQRLQVRGPRPLGVHPGASLALTTRTDRVHLFDRRTGRRLVWVADPGRSNPEPPSSPNPVSTGPVLDLEVSTASAHGTPPHVPLSHRSIR
jgi:multiple sugar transport system ATP-binding protein